MSIIITVSNQKGGVGKTTTSAALASGIALTGRKVLGIDLDPQGNLGFCLGGGRENSHTILDVLKGEVSVEEALVESDTCDLLFSDITLSSNGLENMPGRRECILRDALALVIDQYEYIIIDTPPALNLLTVNAYTTSDFLIIPMSSDILSLVGLAQLKETIESCAQYVQSGFPCSGHPAHQVQPAHAPVQRCARSGKSAGRADRYEGI